MRFTVKMLLTCILHFDARPGCDQNCLQVVGRFLSQKICPCAFFFGDTVALLQVSYTFLWRQSYVSCSYLIELMFLELDVYMQVYSSFWSFWHHMIQMQLFTRNSQFFCVLYMPLFGLNKHSQSREQLPEHNAFFSLSTEANFLGVLLVDDIEK